MTHLRLLYDGEDPLQETIEIEFDNFSTTKVYHLKERYARLRTLPTPFGLRLYKIDIPPEEFERDKLNLTTDSLLTNGQHLDRYWPNGASDNINVFVTVAATNQARNPPAASEASQELQPPEAMQEKALLYLKSKTSSSWAQPSTYARLQNTRDVGILNGRPAENIGLPIGLYHPIFDTFLSRLHGTDVSSLIGDIPAKFYVDTESLLVASQALYDKETGTAGRDRTIRLELSTLLDYDMPSVERPGAKPDGVVSGQNGAICMVIEVKNEVGTGSADPTIQGALSYAKQWADDMKKSERRRSCCPSFILAIAGPWMCLLGAVMLEQPIVQPLTDFLWVAINPRSVTHFRRLARMFWAMKLSIADLKGYYSSLPPAVSISRFYPYVREYSLANERVGFTYLKHLGDSGSLKTIFTARTMSGVGRPTNNIVVKFAETYNGYAHRLLSDAGLAPKLLFDGSSIMSAPRPSGRMMIVMEHVEARDLTNFGGPIPESVRLSVQKAISILHAHNLVFGDLRRPNVLAIENEQGAIVAGMLIDFDWCGTHGKSRYPETLNTKGISWPQGVERGSLMMKEHDEVMMDRLL